jgi:hypothetical protein
VSAVAPELSVILPADRLATIAHTLDHLRSQSASDRIEIVVVTPSPEGFAEDNAAFAGFAGVLIVEANLDSLPAARAAGVRAARSEIVVLGETHSFPEAGWATALIESHRGPWAVVGPAITNANPPGSQLAWANLLMTYGAWDETGQRGPRSDLPGHNSSFKRAVLLEYGDRLEDMMLSDNYMMSDLAARGHRLLFEPAARTAHLNVSRLASFIGDSYLASRLYASVRRTDWAPARRLLYMAGTPLIPLVRLRRILGQLRRSGRAPELLPGVLPALLTGLLVSALGELVGYVAGVRESPFLRDIELHRTRHVGRHG